MGVSYYAKAVVGVRVPTHKLYEKKTVKAFDHDFPSDWKVDPKTGRELWVRESAFVLEDHGVTEDDYDWRHGKRSNEARATVVFEQGRGDSDRGSNAYVCRTVSQIEVGRSGDWGNKKVIGGPDEFDMVFEATFLRELLEPLGLWDPRNFGVWLISCVS